MTDRKPSFLRNTAIALMGGLALASCAAPQQKTAKSPQQQPVRTVPAPEISTPSAQNRYENIARNQAPAGLKNRLYELWREFPGKTGIAVKRIDGNWTESHRGNQLFPQQSVSKTWVSMTILDQVDRGRISLNDRITMTPDKLTLFYQPMATKVRNEGAVTYSVLELMEMAIARSDNSANDALLWHAAADAVNSFIARNNLGAIRFGPGERLLQSRIAGVEWRQSLSEGRAFQAERAKIPYETRRNLLMAYVNDPMDGASPEAIVNALSRLAREDLLSPSSSRLLMGIMERTKSGPNRLKAGVPAGWQFMHKTGTGQVLGNVGTGYNDIGIMTAPDGTRYAVAVMLAETTASVPQRMELMQNVTRAIAYYHDNPNM